MDTAASPAPDAGTAPDRISVPRIVIPASDVGYEDILAARVIHKAWKAQLATLGVVLAVLGYVGVDLNRKSNALEKTQTQLQAQQESLQARIALTEATVKDYERQIGARVETANRLVGNASDVVNSAGAYQQALADQLVSIGEIRRSTEALQREEDRFRAQVANGLARVDGAVDSASAQRARDTATLSSLTGDVRGALTGLTTTRYQVVEEDSPTPIGTSNFTIEYDGLTALAGHGCTINRVQLLYHQAPVPGWPRQQVMGGYPIPIDVNGEHYRLTVVRGYSRRARLLFFIVSQRIMIKLERVGPGAPPPQDSLSTCEVIRS